MTEQDRILLVEKNNRISELRSFLISTDFKVMPDYDKPNDEIKAQRKLWRDELRALLNEVSD